MELQDVFTFIKILPAIIAMPILICLCFITIPEKISRFKNNNILKRLFENDYFRLIYIAFVAFSICLCMINWVMLVCPE